MQKGRTNQQGRSHSPHYTTIRDGMWIISVAGMDRAGISRAVALQIQFVKRHSVSTRTILRRLQQGGMSAKCPFLCLPLIGNHMRLSRQWCDEWRA
ncbi:transposable element Tcb1 transposase [Trichonephila clavipes]|nr:transposable element Tcb1 transposase [Trichonephila clavipes]